MIIEDLMNSNDKRKTKVIAGFPGIGKTYFMKHNSDKSISDSDSTNFSWADEEKTERNPEFPSNYIQHIKDNLGKVDIILVSTHDEVRKALEDNKIEYTLVYPDKELKDEYIKRYSERGSDYKFMDFINTRWDDMINGLEKETYPKKVSLKSGQFLSDKL